MKRLMLALAALALFLSTTAIPSLADGNPTPTGNDICSVLGCPK